MGAQVSSTPTEPHWQCISVIGPAFRFADFSVPCPERADFCLNPGRSTVLHGRMFPRGSLKGAIEGVSSITKTNCRTGLSSFDGNLRQGVRAVRVGHTRHVLTVPQCAWWASCKVAEPIARTPGKPACLEGSKSKSGGARSGRFRRRGPSARSPTALRHWPQMIERLVLLD